MKTVDDLAQEFADNVAAQTDAIVNGDAKKGNKHARYYIEIFEQLKAIGDIGRDALLPLLEHERADVRITAAAFLLRYRTQEAKSVLEKEAKGQGMPAFEASECLKRWEEGTWQLDL